MNEKPLLIEISIHLHKRDWVVAGVLKIDEANKHSAFKYKKAYMENGYPPLNPSTLNWRSGQVEFFSPLTPSNKHMLDRTFWEMLPGQNDWGNQVLIARFPEYASMNNAQRLYFLGDHSIGGLRARIRYESEEESISNIGYLDNIRDESIMFYQRQLTNIKFVGAVKPLTSYGGVRPKCMYEEDGEFWIVKFNSPDDPYDMAIAEQIAMDMSRDAGLKTADSKLVKLPSGENAFFSKRFDRGGTERRHSLSLFSLVPGNESLKKNNGLPGNPGGFIQALIRRYSDFANMDTLNVVMKMLLDIGVNNTDNHLRNLRIILNDDDKWELAPIYDVIFNPFNQNHVYNPGGLPLNELYLENPILPEAMSKEFGVDADAIRERVEKLKSILMNWEGYCDKYGMSADDKLKIGNAVSLGLSREERNIDISSELSNKPHAEIAPAAPRPKNI